jgi:hypothetical protein
MPEFRSGKRNLLRQAHQLIRFPSIIRTRTFGGVGLRHSTDEADEQRR